MGWHGFNSQLGHRKDKNIGTQKRSSSNGLIENHGTCVSSMFFKRKN